MRSIVYEPQEKGIHEIVKQQFAIAKIICNAGLVPIVETEIDIYSMTKKECKKLLKK